jgi:hypothetical protein
MGGEDESGGKGPGMSRSLLSLSSSFYFLLVLFCSGESYFELCAMKWRISFLFARRREALGSFLCHWFM